MRMKNMQNNAFSGRTKPFVPIHNPPSKTTSKPFFPPSQELQLFQITEFAHKTNAVPQRQLFSNFMTP